MAKDYSTPLDFLKDLHGKRLDSRTLVVGSRIYAEEKDVFKHYKNKVGIDLSEGDGVDIVHDCEKPLPKEIGKFDHIDICSVLEHVQKPWLLAENIMDVMNPKASIFIQVPFVWRVHNYPGDYWRITAQALEILFPHIKWKQRGYITELGFYKISPSTTCDNSRCMHRSELLGYGLLDI